MSDARLQTEIARAIAINHWPTGVNAQFLVFTAGGLLPTTPGFCAYHSAFSLANVRAFTPYAVIPYSGAINACGSPAAVHLTGDPAVDAALVNSGRVRLEMSVDPLLDGWHGTDGGELQAPHIR
jgi:hypothetical protein